MDFLEYLETIRYKIIVCHSFEERNLIMETCHDYDVYGDAVFEDDLKTSNPDYLYPVYDGTEMHGYMKQCTLADTGKDLVPFEEVAAHICNPYDGSSGLDGLI